MSDNADSININSKQKKHLAPFELEDMKDFIKNYEFANLQGYYKIKKSMFHSENQLSVKKFLNDQNEKIKKE